MAYILQFIEPSVAVHAWDPNIQEVRIGNISKFEASLGGVHSKFQANLNYNMWLHLMNK